MRFAQSARPIEGAVATVGVSHRIEFLRKTYGLLGLALIAFAAITGGMMRFATEASLHYSMFALSGWNWLLVMVMFMLVGMGARKLAMSETSRGLQYAGLGLFVVVQALILQPLLWLCILRFGHVAVTNGTLHNYNLGFAGTLILESVGITLAIFGGLTATVFITKKDFSFMRGFLVCCSFAAIGVIIMSMIFGFQLGAVFCGLMILLMAGYILFQTSIIMSQFPPTAFVAAALMLFSTIATLFWYVLQFMMEMNSSRR